VQIENYQVVGYLTLTTIAILSAWSKGYKDGKRVGYHKGRSLAWSIKNNQVSQ